MISRAMKSHTNEHTVRGRPTLKVVESFRNGSVCKAYERSIHLLRANILSEFIKNRVIPKEISALQLNKKHLQKRHRIFRRDREPNRIPARAHKV